MSNKYIGLMSGTSVDSLDISLIEVIDDNTFNLIKYKECKYTKKMKEKIFSAINNVSTIKDLTQLNFELAILYSKEINQFLLENKIDAKEISAIGSHGQTIYHISDPEKNEIKSTLQIVDGSVISELTNIDVVSDFRTAHMAAGGKGAPLVPFGEFMLFNSKNDKKRIWQNIGGISNSTLLSNDENKIISFDNGPGNMIIDNVALNYFGIPFDKGGSLAKKGSIDFDLLSRLLDNDYFRKPLPKTTGREEFGKVYFDKNIKNYDGDKFDLIRTVTFLTAKTIVDSCLINLINDNFKYEFIVSGGGAYNEVLMNDIRTEFARKSNLTVLTAEDLDINSSAKESIIFAYFAYRTIHKLHSAIINGKRKIIGKVSYK